MVERSCALGVRLPAIREIFPVVYGVRNPKHSVAIFNTVDEMREHVFDRVKRRLPVLVRESGKRRDNDR